MPAGSLSDVFAIVFVAPPQKETKRIEEIRTETTGAERKRASPVASRTRRKVARRDSPHTRTAPYPKNKPITDESGSENEVSCI